MASEIAPGSRVGQYAIVRLIGSGGMGEVYEAQHTGLAKRVAIKTLRSRHADNQNVVERFFKEGRLASRIRHPNIVDVTDVGMIGNTPCLVMEYLEGETLQERFRKLGKLPAEALVDILLPVIAALDAAHEQGVVHRDLKPANIFITQAYGRDAQPKLVDFGISKLMDESHTGSGGSSFLGSPHYASPELAQGEDAIDARADQYALGVILYEGLCGRRPFQDRATSFMALMHAIAASEFPPPRDINPDLSVELEAVMLRAMENRPANRFESMKELGRHLLPDASPRARLNWEPVLGQAPVRAGGYLNHGKEVPPGPAPTMEARPSGFRWVPFLWQGAVACLVGATVSYGLGSYVVWSKEQPPSYGDALEVEPVATEGSYTLVVKARPSHARLEVDGAELGTGKIRHLMQADGRQHTLRVFAEGHKSRLYTFDEKHLPPQEVSLAPTTDGDVGDAGGVEP